MGNGNEESKANTYKYSTGVICFSHATPDDLFGFCVHCSIL
jgi:hypothetical protein